MSKTWRRQTLEAKAWKKVRRPAEAVCCELRDANIHPSSRDTLMVDGVLID